MEEQMRLEAAAEEQDLRSKRDMGRAFFEYFGELVSEWSRSRDDDGQARHFWHWQLKPEDWELVTETVRESLWTMFWAR